MKKAIATTTVAALLAGCSNIGTLDGVPINQGSTVSSQSAPTYCEVNPAICIIGGALAVGLLGYMVNQSNGGARPVPEPETV